MIFKIKENSLVFLPPTADAKDFYPSLWNYLWIHAFWPAIFGFGKKIKAISFRTPLLREKFEAAIPSDLFGSKQGWRTLYGAKLKLHDNSIDYEEDVLIHEE